MLVPEPEHPGELPLARMDQGFLSKRIFFPLTIAFHRTNQREQERRNEKTTKAVGLGLFTPRYTRQGMRRVRWSSGWLRWHFPAGRGQRGLLCGRTSPSSARSQQQQPVAPGHHSSSVTCKVILTSPGSSGDNAALRVAAPRRSLLPCPHPSKTKPFVLLAKPLGTLNSHLPFPIQFRRQRKHCQNRPLPPEGTALSSPCSAGTEVTLQTSADSIPASEERYGYAAPRKASKGRDFPPLDLFSGLVAIAENICSLFDRKSCRKFLTLFLRLGSRKAAPLR